MSKFAKASLIAVGALVLSTVAIQASDMLQNIDGPMAGLVSQSQGPCSEGMTQVMLSDGALCVDTYEAAAGGSCPVANPAVAEDSVGNVATSACLPVSEPERLPWRFVSLTDAQQLCGRAGKRLPTPDEWYRVSLSQSSQEQCVTDASGPAATGVSNCATQSGIHDVIGNLWEWVDVTISDGRYLERDLPEAGYVAVVDSSGVVVETASEASVAYGDDYAWTNLSGVFGMVRGGFFGARSDAGLYAQNLAVPLDLRTAGVGFRCVRDVAL